MKSRAAVCSARSVWAPRLPGWFAVPFTLLLLLVLSEWEPLERLDKSVANDLHGYVSGHPTTVDLLEAGGVALDPFVFRGLVIIVAGWLWWRGAKRLAVWALVTMAIGGVLGVVLKQVVERSRPAFPEPVMTAGGFCFPSGSCTQLAALRRAS